MKISRINKLTQSKSWLVGLVLASLVGGFLAYRFLRPQEQHQDLSALTVPVKTRDLRVRVSASGTIVSLENVNLSPKTAGRLTQLFVDQGDRVQKGQILAKMDDRDVRAQLQKAKADLAQAQAHLAELQVGSLPQQINDAQAQVNTAQARLTLSQRRRQRNQELAKLGAISQDQLAPFIAEARTDRVALEKAQRNLELVSKGTRPASIAQAQAQVAQAQAQLQAIQVQLEDTLIRAPFSGTVTQKYATVGAFVTPTTSASATSSATSTSIVALNSGTEALANVPEVDVGQIRPGQLVEIVADAYPGQTFWGRVHLIAPEAVVQQNVTSFQDEVAVIPVTTMANRLVGRTSPYGIGLQFISVLPRDDAASMEAAEFQITNLLRRRHQITGSSVDDFVVRNQKDALAVFSNVSGALTILLATIATISLFVGGIGIMNIMLVSVTERTQEIGLRKAIGASKIHILQLFLTEAVILSLLGGSIGTVLGAGATLLIGIYTPLKTGVSLGTITLAVGVSGSIGLIFGVLPAQRAARLDPIVALKSI